MFSDWYSRRGFLRAFAVCMTFLAVPSSAVAGDAASQRQADADRENDRRLIRRVQSSLKDKGFDPGPIDGMMGRRTSDALSAFQRSQGLEQTGAIGPRTMRALWRIGRRVRARERGRAAGHQGLQCLRGTAAAEGAVLHRVQELPERAGAHPGQRQPSGAHRAHPGDYARVRLRKGPSRPTRL